MRPRIAAIGLIVFDEIIVDDGAVGPKVTHVGYRLGGKGFNMANALDRLDVDASLVSVVGSDGVGDKAREVLVRRGIDDSFIYTCVASNSSVPTPCARITEGHDGRRSVQLDLDPRVAAAELTNLEEMTPQNWDALIFSLEPPNSRAPGLIKALDHVREALPECLIFVHSPGARDDIRNEDTFSAIKRADVVSVNLQEANLLLGRDSDDVVTDTLAEELSKHLAVPVVFIATSPSSWVWFRNGESGSGSIPEAVDDARSDVFTAGRIGATDVFVAAVASWMVRGEDFPVALTAGAYAGRLTVERGGGIDQFPTRDEVCHLVEKQEAVLSDR